MIPENGKELVQMINRLTYKRSFYPERVMQAFNEAIYTEERKKLIKQSNKKFKEFI